MLILVFVFGFDTTAIIAKIEKNEHSAWVLLYAWIWVLPIRNVTVHNARGAMLSHFAKAVPLTLTR